MSAEMMTAVSAMAVSAITAGGGVTMAVIGRRQPRGASRRADITLVTNQHRKEIERLDKRVDELESDADRDRARAARDRQKINAQDYALRYVAAWVRELVGYIRRTGGEPPAPPQPVPAEAQPYLHDIGV